MIIVMKKNAEKGSIQRVIDLIVEHGLQEHISQGAERTIIGVVGDERILSLEVLEKLPDVERAIRVLSDWKIISRESMPDSTMIKIGGAVFGGEKLLHIRTNLKEIKEADAIFLDPFYLPIHPYLDAERNGKKAQIDKMKNELIFVHQNNKPALVRIRDVRQIENVLTAGTDVLYLGGELMSNRALLEEVGRLNTPVVLCKDKHHRVDDWLVAAEHIALKGNHHIILGESGTIHFEAVNQHRLDVESIVKVRRQTHLPVIANITRLSHQDMSQKILYHLAIVAGVNGIILS